MSSNALSIARGTLPAPANVTPIDRARLAKLVRELSDSRPEEQIAHAGYARELFRLQTELVKLQDWVHNNKLKLVVLFEGRDAAGKGGAIKRIVHRLNPRLYRIAALASPTEQERRQWYFQRYVAHLPAGGEIVFFDRSWYNRAGVERVMGFCSEEEYREFLATVPEFERMLIRSGIMLIKYWFSITYEEQLRRLRSRACNPIKQWKLSPMDVQSLYRWDDYTRAKEIMLQRTHIPEAPWWIVDAVDKRKARLNCIRHLLGQVPYQELPRREIVLPEELPGGGHARRSGPAAMHVPEVY
ncbi:MAG: polyphosphate kinase 2 [Rhodomicrobium sp.]